MDLEWIQHLIVSIAQLLHQSKYSSRNTEEIKAKSAKVITASLKPINFSGIKISAS
jgi:hypothetical protein